MAQPQFSLSWESYKSSICAGFSSLQQNGEFVDMTLAADGHFVKVHQVLLALASPYLRELIGSAPCQHPVIFLNNVSYQTLSSILEYIYTGEVLVPSDNFKQFITAAKALFIRGLENISSGDSIPVKMMTSHLPETLRDQNITGLKRMAIPTESVDIEVELPVNAKRIRVKHEGKSTYQSKAEQAPEDPMDYSSTLDDTPINDSDDDLPDSKKDSANTSKTTPAATSLQFTVSNRGSLQVILNRYMYNLHSNAQKAGMRRWRCVDYRNQRCPAYIVTKGNSVVNRSNLHNHTFHDKKILSKIERKTVYSAIDDVTGYKERETTTTDKEQEDLTIDQDHFILGGVSDYESSEVRIDGRNQDMPSIS